MRGILEVKTVSKNTVSELKFKFASVSVKKVLSSLQLDSIDNKIDTKSAPNQNRFHISANVKFVWHNNAEIDRLLHWDDVLLFILIWI